MRHPINRAQMAIPDAAGSALIVSEIGALWSRARKFELIVAQTTQ
jgi:hypothetical protein